ncbi:hypothetical protein FB45DRAFT_871372 [Roridomyces roridus]|uniref:Uncharacterized protein n=1 Tax=Roridomyces roridus TaxID=1738132 RepID=A0AAD7FHJ9_9AGAR|nr:hypothetical protein FB45DRAFT_871372 [Roridomyces roridus]
MKSCPVCARNWPPFCVPLIGVGEAASVQLFFAAAVDIAVWGFIVLAVPVVLPGLLHVPNLASVRIVETVYLIEQRDSDIHTGLNLSVWYIRTIVTRIPKNRLTHPHPGVNLILVPISHPLDSWTSPQTRMVLHNHGCPPRPPPLQTFLRPPRPSQPLKQCVQRIQHGYEEVDESAEGRAGVEVREGEAASVHARVKFWIDITRTDPECSAVFRRGFADSTAFLGISDPEPMSKADCEQNTLASTSSSSSLRIPHDHASRSRRSHFGHLLLLHRPESDESTWMSAISVPFVMV